MSRTLIRLQQHKLTDLSNVVTHKSPTNPSASWFRAQVCSTAFFMANLPCYAQCLPCYYAILPFMKCLP
eukprot:1157302-Pelagomonas_calceolata.AAC.9